MDKLVEAFEKRSKKINKIEEMKKTREPHQALEMLKSYAENGYESIQPEDKNFLLKSYGIFDRKTPNSFMLRVRIFNGKMTHKQALKVGEVAKKYGNDYIDITTRMQIQLRYLKIEDMPKVLEELDSVGITTYQTGVDNIRNIVTDPLNEVAIDSYLKTDELVQKMQDIFLKKEEWITKLPRKFNTGINGSITNRANIFGHDFCLSLAEKDGIHGFNLYLGGKVGETAKQTNIFLKDKNEALEVFQTVLKLFKKYGFRDNRNKNRLFYLIEAVGLDFFEEAIRNDSQINFLTAGENLVTKEMNSESLISLKNGEFAKLISVPAGIFNGTDLIDLANLLDSDKGEIRLSYEQNLYLVNVDLNKINSNQTVQKYSFYENRFFRNMIACAGSTDCPFGVIKGKPDAIELSQKLSQTLSIEPKETVKLHWSACPKGCGIHGFGDIGFVGTKTKIDGETVEAVTISIGGKMGLNPKEGEAVFKNIPLNQADKYVSKLINYFDENKTENESFSDFETRVLSKFQIEDFENLVNG